MQGYLKAWKQYAVFRGRSTRAEYWVFALVNFAIVIVLVMPGTIAQLHAVSMEQMPHLTPGRMIMGGVADIFILAQIIPSLAVQVRRLHDTDRSGWWWLIGFIPLIGWILLLVWYCTQGTSGDNRYGSDPLGGQGNVGASIVGSAD